MAYQIKFDIDLTKGQRLAYELIHKPTTKTLVLRWSRQCGKTILAEILMIEYLCKNGLFSCYVSPTFQLGRKVYKELLTLLEGKGIIKKANSSTLTIESVFGSTLQFFSMEAYQSIRGFTVSGILICDEAAYYPDILPNGEMPWANILMPLTKARKPKILIISTPKGRRGMFWDFCKRAEEKEKGIKCLTRTIYDDDLVTPKEIEEIKKTLPPQAFAQEFEVKFLDDSLSFFKGFDKAFIEYEFDKKQKTYLGVDFSAKGEDKTIVTAVNEIGQTMQWQIDNPSLQQRCKQIAQIINSQYDMRCCLLEGNSIGSPMIEEVVRNVDQRYKRRCKEFITTSNSKGDIIGSLAMEIDSGELFFEKDNTDLYSEMGNFIIHYSKTGRPQFEARSGHDDRIMSLAIAVEARGSVPTEYSIENNNVNFIKSKSFNIL